MKPTLEEFKEHLNTMLHSLDLTNEDLEEYINRLNQYTNGSSPSQKSDYSWEDQTQTRKSNAKRRMAIDKITNIDIKKVSKMVDIFSFDITELELEINAILSCYKIEDPENVFHHFDNKIDTSNQLARYLLGVSPFFDFNSLLNNMELTESYPRIVPFEPLVASYDVDRATMVSALKDVNTKFNLDKGRRIKVVSLREYTNLVKSRRLFITPFINLGKTLYKEGKINFSQSILGACSPEYLHLIDTGSLLGKIYKDNPMQDNLPISLNPEDYTLEELQSLSRQENVLEYFYYDIIKHRGI